MTDLVVVEEIQILTQEVADEILLEEVEVIEILTEAGQGPEGRQGPPGPTGGATLVTVGGAPISGHSVVAVNAAGELVPADCTIAAQQGAVLGMLANAYSPGDQAVVQTSFVLEHAGWSWTPGPVFVGAAGQPTQALPPGALFSQAIAQAISPTRVLIDPQPPITIA